MILQQFYSLVASGAGIVMEKERTDSSTGRLATVGLIVFAIYVIVLALAAVSEFFNLGWFNHPVFK